jgi:hypothetical protein
LTGLTGTARSFREAHSGHEVSADQLSDFFGRIPDGEQAFLKENLHDPQTVAAWRGPGPARRRAAIDEAGTLVGVVSMIPLEHRVGELSLVELQILPVR